MFVGGGSFQEYCEFMILASCCFDFSALIAIRVVSDDGDSFTSWATISGPAFRGLPDLPADKDVNPTGFQDCMFFGNCSGGYGGCENQTMFYTGEKGLPCSKVPVPAAATCGVGGRPAVSFKGGTGQPVATKFVPPWYRWAAAMSADGSEGPDGGMLPPSDSCAFEFHAARAGGATAFANWATVPFGGSQPYSMPPVEVCNNETGVPMCSGTADSAGNPCAMNSGNTGCAVASGDCTFAAGRFSVGACSKQCCAYCLADKDCVEAQLNGNTCQLIHLDPKLPFNPYDNASMGITTVVPRK